MSDHLGANRFDKLLDEILPPWRDKTGYRHRWTTPRGLFSVEVTPDGPQSRCEFSGPVWAMTVPATIAGIDALIVAMTLAGAIELPAEPEGLVIGNVGVAVRIEQRSGDGKPFVFGSIAAFATGLKLIERCGHTPNWRREWSLPGRPIRDSPQA